MVVGVGMTCGEINAKNGVQKLLKLTWCVSRTGDSHRCPGSCVGGCAYGSLSPKKWGKICENGEEMH